MYWVLRNFPYLRMVKIWARSGLSSLFPPIYSSLYSSSLFLLSFLYVLPFPIDSFLFLWFLYFLLILLPSSLLGSECDYQGQSGSRAIEAHWHRLPLSASPKPPPLPPKSALLLLPISSSVFLFFLFSPSFS